MRYTTAAENVALGWLGIEVPPPVKHRNKTRASYRKTSRVRGGHREARLKNERPPKRALTL